MYDSMPQYQFLSEQDKKEFFRSRTDSYYLSLRTDTTIRGPSHNKRVAFADHSEVRCTPLKY